MHSLPNIHDLERTHGVTWHELVDLEPKLAQLLWESRQACVICRRWPDVDRIFTPIRDALTELVGFARKHHWHPVLGSLGAYEVAYWKLYSAVAASLQGQASNSAYTLGEVRARKVAATSPNGSIATSIQEELTYPAQVCVTNFQI